MTNKNCTKAGRNILNRCLLGTFLALAMAMSGFPQALASETAPDLTRIIRDTQKVSNENHELTIVWWIPTDFWKASLASSGTLTKAQQDKFLAVVKPYTLVVVIHGDIGQMGNVTYENVDAIRSRLTIADAKGRSYKPLAMNDYSGELDNFLNIMNPILSKMLGPMGKNFNFFVFAGKTPEGDPIADPMAKAAFSVNLGEQKFDWHLPLDCFTPPKKCPKCKESLSGTFDFCPYDGTPLRK